MQLDGLPRGLPLLAKVRSKRSGGVKVSGPVHQQIDAGNAARDLRAWTVAAEAFRVALELDPSLTHIWIQRGHALKESGKLDEAIACYRRAVDLDPEKSDPHLHLGHAAKLMGDISGASRHYLDAARLHPPSNDAIAELRSLIMKGARINMSALNDLISQPAELARILDASTFSTGGPDAGPQPRQETGGRSSGTCMVFDVSDLLSYFNHARTPSGIQRVQLETLTEALRNSAHDVRICAFHEARDEWIELPRGLFLELCARSRSGTEEDWSICFTKVTVCLGVGEPFVFPIGAFLINLGTSWWIPNYFMFVRRAKQDAGIRYVPFVHDLIPLVRSDLCPPALVRDFMAWIVSVLEQADFYLVNSQSTKADLMKVSAYLNRPIDPARIEVVTLDAAPQHDDKTGVDKSTLHRFGLQRGTYVLFVSTIEPRKNHLLAFEAWSKLIDRHGTKRVPKLVCVGNSGWMNEPIHDHLKARPDLRSKVLTFSNVSDEDLHQLYKGCLFTLYPSNYEGWGLPVTESLSHGKVPLCSRVSSIPEAGGDSADYFDLDARGDLIAGVERLAFDNAYRHAREKGIATTFKPRTWEDIARQILENTAAWTGGGARTRLKVPQVDMGRYYSLSRNLAAGLWPGLQSTESFRVGSSWWGRDPWGCWTKPGGGTLSFTVADATKPSRIYLDLLGMPHVPCQLRIDANGREGVEEAGFEANERKWISFEIPCLGEPDQPVVIDLVCGTFEELARTTFGGDARAISIGVGGFYICDAADAAARVALIEAVTLTSVESLSANRPPAGYVSLEAYLEGRDVA